MKIAEIYSHLNGLEYLLVHKKKLWEELKTVISFVDAEKCKTKTPKERTKRGKTFLILEERSFFICYGTECLFHTLNTGKSCEIKWSG